MIRVSFVAIAAGAALVGGCQQAASSAAASASGTSASASNPSSAPPPPTTLVPGSLAPSARTMTADAFGPVRVGMTQAQALAALGAGWSAEPGSNESCSFIGDGNDGAAFQRYMLVGGQVVGARADDYAPQAGRTTVVTDRGVGLGSTEAQVRAAYPQGLEALPASINDHRFFLRTAPANGRSVQFLTNSANVVVSMAAGDPAVFSIDGCG